MPPVKTEELDIRTLSSNGLSLSSASLPRQDHGHNQRRAIERSARIHNNALPYSTGDRAHGQPSQAPAIFRPEHINQPHPAVFAQAIGQASHEVLTRTGNITYQRVIQELSQAQAIIAEYYRRDAELCERLRVAQDAYMRLYTQHEDRMCQQTQRIQQPVGPGHTKAPSPTPSPHPPLERQQNSGPSDAPPPPVLIVNEFCGPVTQPGGFRLIHLTGPWCATPLTRPSDLPFEVFWHKSDWFGKGYPNGTFVTDRNGKHLSHLMRGARRTARSIWTEIDQSPGKYVAKSFNKNGSEFLDVYVGTIEEIYPCLKLCYGHWKALQIGISAYSHWYKNREKIKKSQDSNN